MFSGCAELENCAPLYYGARLPEPFVDCQDRLITLRAAAANDAFPTPSAECIQTRDRPESLLCKTPECAKVWRLTDASSKDLNDQSSVSEFLKRTSLRKSSHTCLIFTVCFHGSDDSSGILSLAIPSTADGFGGFRAADFAAVVVKS